MRGWWNTLIGVGPGCGGRCRPHLLALLWKRRLFLRAATGILSGGAGASWVRKEENIIMSMHESLYGVHFRPSFALLYYLSGVEQDAAFGG